MIKEMKMKNDLNAEEYNKGKIIKRMKNQKRKKKKNLKILKNQEVYYNYIMNQF